MPIDQFDTRLSLDNSYKVNEEVQKKQQEEIRKKALMYQEILDKGNGKKIVDDLKQTFLANPSYMPGYNTNDTCYFEGQKAVLNYIMYYLNFK